MSCEKLAFLLAACATLAQSVPLHGSYGGVTIPFDVEFGDDYMLVTIHKPENASESFKATTNLHIFSKKLVAMKNDVDNECYIQAFIESKDELQGRIMNAEYNNGLVGNVLELRLTIEGLTPLDDRTIRVLLGRKIADFCAPYPVFLLEDVDHYPLVPTGTYVHRRRRAADVERDVSRVCNRQKI